MAAIIADGPGEWAVDVLNRKMGRAFAAVVAVLMLVDVAVISAGPARVALALGAAFLAGVAARPANPADLRHAPTTADLAQVEAELLRFREEFDEHEEFAVARAGELLELVEQIRAQLR